ncbi:hypothetical protein ACGFNP_34635 [Nonomuraea sp. NPDC049269]|uniref:hypothetical protein n=1 Tax=Nonomuraea sp. NPDC049269 TaxID=3364349 RepID=UPI00371A9A39
MSPLEARYRRLLACYPRDHRARHEEEMISVLLAGARPGQTRPDPADMADLLWGALRVHGRRAFGPASAPAWRDGLALALALWPFLMLASVLATEFVVAAEALHNRGLAGVLRLVPWLVVVALAAGYACRSVVGRRAALLLFLPVAVLGNLGDLPYVSTPTAFAQIGCAALAFAAAAALTWRRSGPATPVRSRP